MTRFIHFIRLFESNSRDIVWRRKIPNVTSENFSFYVFSEDLRLTDGEGREGMIHGVGGRLPMGLSAFWRETEIFGFLGKSFRLQRHYCKSIESKYKFIYMTIMLIPNDTPPNSNSDGKSFHRLKIEIQCSMLNHMYEN